MKIKTIGITIISLLSLFSCISLFSHKKEEDNLMYWKLDVFGCKGYRNKEHAYYIRDSLDLRNTNKRFVINKIGTPDLIKTNNNEIILKYYFDSKCNNGVLIDSIDYCWVEIQLISNRVKSTTILCY